jgi:hypothetical protein
MKFIRVRRPAGLAMGRQTLVAAAGGGVKFEDSATGSYRRSNDMKTTPDGYLINPPSVNQGQHVPVQVGKTQHLVPTGSQVKMTSISGHPVAIIKQPDNLIRQLHVGGELPLSKSQQDARRLKYFPDK